MSRPVSRLRIIGAIVRKDIAEYARDRLWAFLTVLVIVVVVGLFWILPDSVDESIDLGVAGIGDPAVLAGLESAEAEGLRLVMMPSGEDIEAVIAGDAAAWVGDDGRATVVNPGSGVVVEDTEKVTLDIGIAFPRDFFTATAAGEQTEVTVYLDADVPDELQTAVTSLVRELAFTVAGEELPVDTAEPNQVFVVLGTDRVGDQASLRDGMKPLFVFLVLLMEMFVMASLIAKEIQERTVTAMLVTPATIADVLAAKGIAGAASGFGQAVIILIAINSLSVHPVLVLTFMLLGAILVAGVAMIAGSTGKDFMSTLFNGMVYMIPLMIPAFAALFPGTPSLWVRVIPSYPLVRGLVDVMTYGAGWSDSLPELAAVAAWCVGLFVLGWVVLKRKVQSL